MTRIAIVGAGLSGRLLALNLMRQASDAVSITLIDRGDGRGVGPAYSAAVDYLLLNVPAGRMGAFSADPEHFLNWVQAKGGQADRFDFLPRQLYRDYILYQFQQAQQAKASGVSFEYVCGEVTDIQASPGDGPGGGLRGVTVFTQGDAVFAVDMAVLALGNFPPRHPQIQHCKALDSPRYMQNPWVPGVLDALRQDDTVFLIGTGQTTVDLAVGLYSRGHQGRILAVSRHGLLPLVHITFEPYPPFFDEIKDLKSIYGIFRVVRQHFDRAEAMGMDRRGVIDSLRPFTQTLWQNLPAQEQRKFLRGLFRYWEIIRSRIPPQSQAILEKMRSAGQLEVIAGQIRDLADSEAAMDVHYSLRGKGREEIVQAALVINCAGPETDYERVEHPLVQNLLRRGLIRPSPIQLGLNALPNGAVIGRDGAVSNALFTLGSPMKGVLWEVLAVPEIRVQAEQLASLLLSVEAGRSIEASRAEPASPTSV
jgi:uncharacterized NAD(P)/FAD-binding protein YdhS